MDLLAEEFHGRDSFLRWPRKPIVERRASTPLLIEGRQPDNSL